MILGVVIGFYLGSNLLAVALSYAMIRGAWASRRLRGKTPTMEAWRKRLPLFAFNVATIATLTSIAIVLAGDAAVDLGPIAPWRAVAWAIFYVLVDDFCMYSVHRLLHVVPVLYRHIHQLHHRAYPCVPTDYIYAHPVELLIGYIGVALAFGINLLVEGHISAWSLAPYLIYRVFHELDIHSGIRGPWRWGPFAEVEHHDQHHARPHSGNFASAFRLWDYLLGTLSR